MKPTGLYRWQKTKQKQLAKLYTLYTSAVPGKQNHRNNLGKVRQPHFKCVNTNTDLAMTEDLMAWSKASGTPNSSSNATQNTQS